MSPARPDPHLSDSTAQEFAEAAFAATRARDTSPAEKGIINALLAATRRR